MTAQPHSAHARGRRHTVVMTVAMFAIVWGIPLGLIAYGVQERTIFPIVVPLLMAWMLIGGIRCAYIVCPNCSKSVFIRASGRAPWPEKQCSKCNRDLTQVIPGALR